MKSQKIIYWSTTSLFSLMMFFSAIAYFTNEEVKEGFTQLGYPSYFRIELAIAKIIGVIALLLPLISTRLKEWAYAGFVITLISAFIAHLAHGDDASKWIPTLVGLAILLTSYFSLHKLKSATN